MTVDLIIIAVSLLVAAFSGASETSLNSISKIRVRTLADEGNRRARRVARLQADPRQAYLGTILLLNTLALIVAGAAAGVLSSSQWPNVPEIVATLVLSLVALVFCEFAPKSLALQHSERYAFAVVGVVEVLTRVLRPLVRALTGLSTLLIRAATRNRTVRGPFVTEQELKMLLNMGEREGVIEEEEQEMIQGVLELTDKVAREVMVPRVDVIGVEVTASVEDVVRLIIEHGHSRIPVYDTTIDNVVALVYAKDVLRHRETGGGATSLREMARPPYFTPELKRAGELLIEMRLKKVHMAIVVDEYGGTAGIVTIEDLLEEIVGEIRDEYDIAETEEIQFLNDCEVLLSARVSIDDVKELLHLDIPDTEADSIGGLVYERLGEIPVPGATLTIGEATLTVDTVRRQSIRTVRIASPNPFQRGEEPAREGAAEAVGERDPG